MKWIQATITQHWLLLVRLGLATVVLLSHSVPLAYGADAEAAHEWFKGLSRGQVTGGDVAVAAFFIISGFLVTSSWQRESDFRRYALRRWRRIFPGFAGAYLFSVFLVPALADPSESGLQSTFTAVNPLAHLFMIGTLHVPFVAAFAALPLPSFTNGSAWMLPYEAWGYALVPLLGVCGVLHRRGVFIALFVGVLAIAAVGLRDSANVPFTVYYLLGTPEKWPRLLACFLAGTICCLYREALPRAKVVPVVAISVLLATMLVGHGLVIALPICGALLLLPSLGAVDAPH